MELLVEPVLERCAAPVRRALKDAGLEPAALSGVILVGGATRMPLVRQFVEELFGRAPLADIDPDQVVALGAAVQADMLAGGGGRGRRAAARRGAAVAGARDDGRRGREDHPPQLDDPVRRDADVHDLRRQADRLRPARGAGRARDGRRVPLAGALHAEGDPADAGRDGAARGDVPGRRRRHPARHRRARRPPARRRRSRSSRATA